MCLKISVCVFLFATLLEGTPANSSVKIVGGIDAFTSVEWQASLRLIPNDRVFGNGHYCGGVLINFRVVLTAGHCLVNENGKKILASRIRIVGGSHRLSTSYSYHTYIGGASRTVLHPNYKHRELENDIGTIVLDTLVNPASPVFRPIQLASKITPINNDCIISVWGHLSYQGETPDYLQKAYVYIINRQNCANAYGSRLRPNTICAGRLEGGVDTCQGDSGGPLVCNNVLAGITSTGDICARPGFPGIYTDVTKFLQWIETNSSPAMLRSSEVAIIMMLAVIVIRWF